MDFRLVDTGWDAELDACVQAGSSSLRIVSPFIQARAAKRLLRYGRPEELQVVTRYSLRDFHDGVSDLSALRLLLDHGARIRGIRNLHAKLYLFGAARAMVTSANLTESALTRNQEFGFVAGDPDVVSRCVRYFEYLWEAGREDLAAARLSEWEQKIRAHRATAGPSPSLAGLRDEGAELPAAVPPATWPVALAPSAQAFVKFFGEGHRRADRATAVMDEVDRSGCHWACSYPRDRRPRKVRDGATMFIARLVDDPNDILVYGRAVGMAYVRGRDDASEADLASRPWKSTWPHYVRVRDAEFVAGSLSNGISLGELMDTLGHDSFASVQRNSRAGRGNTNPRKSIRQQPAVELTAEAATWLGDRLEAAFEQHGRLLPSALAQLDWPEQALSDKEGLG